MKLLRLDMTFDVPIRGGGKYRTVTQLYKCIQLEKARPDKDVTEIRTLFEYICVLETLSRSFSSRQTIFTFVQMMCIE